MSESPNNGYVMGEDRPSSSSSLSTLESPTEPDRRVSWIRAAVVEYADFRGGAIEHPENLAKWMASQPDFFPGPHGTVVNSSSVASALKRLPDEWLVTVDLWPTKPVDAKRGFSGHVKRLEVAELPKEITRHVNQLRRWRDEKKSPTRVALEGVVTEANEVVAESEQAPIPTPVDTDPVATLENIIIDLRVELRAANNEVARLTAERQQFIHTGSV